MTHAMFRKFQNAINDNIELLTGRRDILTPPKRMIFVGDGDYKKTGEEFLDYFIRLGGLKPADTVLDVGCGIGRMAVPLAKYLNKNGRYEGFDIVRKGIDWCKKNITPRYHNFHFSLADIYNKNYNPKGAREAFRYVFPYHDEFFDFAFASSVFTHMLPADAENYFFQIAHTLKKGARCLITFFLLNKESIGLIKAGKSSLGFKYDINGCKTIDKDKPEAAIAYDEESVLELHKRAGLGVINPVHYGSWCGRPVFLSCQDIVISQKSTGLTEDGGRWD